MLYTYWMRAPTEIETVAFFKSIGYRVKKQKGGQSNPPHWLLFEPGDAFGQRCSSLLDIWVRWIPYAQRIINEDAKFRDFMAAYKTASTNRKAELRVALDDYRKRFMIPTALAPYANGRYSNTTDALPRNWKSKVRKLLTQPDGILKFPVRAKEALERLDSRHS